MRLLIGLVLLTMLLSLQACQGIQGIFETEPPAPTESESAHVLCARSGQGAYLFGPVQLSHADTKETQDSVIAHNAAWRAATKNGELCGKLGAATFGGVTWGTK